MAGPRRRRGPGVNPALIIVPLMFAGAIAAVTVVNASSDDPSGKPGVIAALGVVVVGVVALMILQGRWMARVRDADLAEVRGDGGPAEARADSWALADRVRRRGVIVTLMVVVLVPPGIILEEPRLLLLAAVPIVLVGLWAAIDTMRSGGVLDQAYALADAELEPLGLRILERPQVTLIPYATGDVHASTIGPTVIGGVRDGREVEVQLAGGRSTVAVRAAIAAFAERRVGAVELTCDGAVVTAARRRGGPDHWREDLELAESVARAWSPPG